MEEWNRLYIGWRRKEKNKRESGGRGRARGKAEGNELYHGYREK